MSDLKRIISKYPRLEWFRMKVRRPIVVVSTGTLCNKDRTALGGHRDAINTGQKRRKPSGGPGFPGRIKGS